jgi:membrane protein DedA with SNARE-associated domain
MEWNEILESILEWIGQQDKIWIWIFFFFSNFAENVFPPWPGDTVTVFGGFFVATTTEANPSGFGMPGLIASTILGNIAGAYTMYKIGHRFLNFVRNKDFPFKDELYSEEKIEITFGWFRKNAILVVVLSRFSAGIRFFVSIVAGMVKMNLFLFFSLFTVAVIFWCGLLIAGGYSLGNNWEHVLEYLAIYNRMIIGFIIIGSIGYFSWKYVKKKPSLK